MEEIEKGLDFSLTPEAVDKVKNIKMNQVVSLLKKSSSRAYMLLENEMAFNDYQKMYDEINFLNDIDFEFINSVGKKYLNKNRLNYISLKPEKP